MKEIFSLDDLFDKVKKSEFKDKVQNTLSTRVENLDWSEKLYFIENEIYRKDSDLNASPANKGESWSDDELRLVLSLSPTRHSIMLLSKAMKRSHGSLEQIYRWAGQSVDTIESKRPNDKFIQQILKIRKEVGWVSYGGID